MLHISVEWLCGSCKSCRFFWRLTSLERSYRPFLRILGQLPTFSLERRINNPSPNHSLYFSCDDLQVNSQPQVTCHLVVTSEFLVKGQSWDPIHSWVLQAGHQNSFWMAKSCKILWKFCSISILDALNCNKILSILLVSILNTETQVIQITSLVTSSVIADFTCKARIIRENNWRKQTHLQRTWRFNGTSFDNIWEHFLQTMSNSFMFPRLVWLVIAKKRLTNGILYFYFVQSH